MQLQAICRSRQICNTWFCCYHFPPWFAWAHISDQYNERNCYTERLLWLNLTYLHFKENTYTDVHTFIHAWLISVSAKLEYEWNKISCTYKNQSFLTFWYERNPTKITYMLIGFNSWDIVNTRGSNFTSLDLKWPFNVIEKWHKMLWFMHSMWSIFTISQILWPWDIHRLTSLYIPPNTIRSLHLIWYMHIHCNLCWLTWLLNYTKNNNHLTLNMVNTYTKYSMTTVQVFILGILCLLGLYQLDPVDLRWPLISPRKKYSTWPALN